MPAPELVRYRDANCLVLKRLGGLVRIRLPFGGDRTVPARECSSATVGISTPPDYLAPGEEKDPDESQLGLFD